MAVKTTVDFTEGSYFITFTCRDWLSLFEITKSYDTVYKWFDYLKTRGHYLNGYVIMPNHLHVLIDFKCSAKSINIIVSDAKRFIAYEIIRRLKEQGNAEILLQLAKAVSASDKEKGKIHQVFERSFDCKQITSQHFYAQKLSYIHDNPCSGRWKLAENPIDYLHSSAKYFITGAPGIYPIPG